MDPEGIDGVRMTWNIWPRTKLESTNCVVPVAASISPIHHHRDIITLPYAPLLCRACSSALNPFATVDFAAKKWTCPLPLHYHQISETNLPHELHAHHTTFEYTLPNRSDRPSGAAFLFVLDTCMIDEEFGFARSSVKRAVGLLPDEALVGFVSFGTQVHVHELGFPDLAKVYVFRGR